MKGNFENIRKSLQDYISNSNVSLSSLSRDLGYSKSTISAFLSGTYRGDNGRLATRIEQYLNKIQKRGRSLYIPVVETEAYKYMQEALSMTEVEGIMSLIVGDNGIGKTVAIKDYAEEHESILIESDPGDTPISILKTIAAKLGLSAVGRLQAIRDQIIESAPSRLLIVDEAENLPIKSLNFLRRIFDKSRLALALVGGPDIRGMFRSMRSDHKYLWRRIEMHVELPAMNEEDADKIMKACGIKITDSAKEMLVSISQGNTSILVKLLKMCYKLITRNGYNSVSESVVKIARKLLLV